MVTLRVRPASGGHRKATRGSHPRPGRRGAECHPSTNPVLYASSSSATAQAPSGAPPAQYPPEREFQEPLSVRLAWDAPGMQTTRCFDLSLVEPGPPAPGDPIAALFDEELRLLAVGIGGHLPVEVSDRVARLRDERRELEFARVGA